MEDYSSIGQHSPGEVPSPIVMENREFVDLEEEDIQRLNWNEAKKFEQNPKIEQVMSQVEAELGSPGRWEEHWLTIDASGRRVYARVYYTDEQGVAIASDGQIIREFNYPPPDERKLH
jgi:hypothetical protein